MLPIADRQKRNYDWVAYSSRDENDKSLIFFAVAFCKQWASTVRRRAEILIKPVP